MEKRIGLVVVNVAGVVGLLGCGSTPSAGPDAGSLGPDAGSPGSDAGLPDPGAPPLELAFPPRWSVTEADALMVRGRASGGVAIAEVRVNGVLAVTDNGFADWQIDLPLGRGAELDRGREPGRGGPCRYPDNGAGVALVYSAGEPSGRDLGSDPGAHPPPR